MAIATITLGSSTLPVPSKAKVWSDGAINVLTPINGASIIQIGAYGNSLGDKNAPKTLTYDALPTSSTDWSHTIATLKALEGTQVSLNMGSYFSSAYAFATTILISSVKIEFLGRGFTNTVQDLYSVEITFYDV